MTESDDSFAVSKNSICRCDDKEASKGLIYRREVPRRVTRSSRESVEPIFVVPAIAHDIGRSGNVDRVKVEGPRKATQRSVANDAFPRGRSARLAGRNHQLPTQPIERQGHTSKQAPQQSRTQTVHESFSTRVLTECLEFIALWILDTLKIVMRLVRFPASVFVVGLIAAMITGHSVAFLSGLMSKAIFAPFSTLPSMPSISSICGLPMVSVLCQLPVNPQQRSPPVKFDEMMKVQAKFQEVMMSSAECAPLPFEMLRGQGALRHLSTLIEYSSLRSK